MLRLDDQIIEAIQKEQETGPPKMKETWQRYPSSYVVISPVRNEVEYIEKTIESMIHQTILPIAWVIVNDGSTDATELIVLKYSLTHPWIKLVNRADRGKRERGKGVVEAFYTGLDTVKVNYEFVVKLDGDVSFSENYFECLLQGFYSNPKLGIAGGGLYEWRDGKTWKLWSVRDHVRGPTKVYRRSCFNEIGGLIPSLGWDGIDEWKALSLGWQVESFLDNKIFHYRSTGGVGGSLHHRIEQGYGAYRMGYHPLFILARGLRKTIYRPYLIGGLAMIGSYTLAWLQKQEMVADPELVRYIRKTQMRKLIGLLSGKPIYD